MHISSTTSRGSVAIRGCLTINVNSLCQLHSNRRFLFICLLVCGAAHVGVTLDLVFYATLLILITEMFPFLNDTEFNDNNSNTKYTVIIILAINTVVDDVGEDVNFKFLKNVYTSESEDCHRREKFHPLLCQHNLCCNAERENVAGILQTTGLSSLG